MAKKTHKYRVTIEFESEAPLTPVDTSLVNVENILEYLYQGAPGNSHVPGKDRVEFHDSEGVSEAHHIVAVYIESDDKVGVFSFPAEENALGFIDDFEGEAPYSYVKIPRAAAADQGLDQSSDIDEIVNQIGDRTGTLQDLVLDEVSQLGAGIANESPADQVDYLFRNGWSKDDILKRFP